VTEEEIEEYIDEMGFKINAKTSAFTGENIIELF